MIFSLPVVSKVLFGSKDVAKVDLVMEIPIDVLHELNFHCVYFQYFGCLFVLHLIGVYEASIVLCFQRKLLLCSFSENFNANSGLYVRDEFVCQWCEQIASRELGFGEAM